MANGDDAAGHRAGDPQKEPLKREDYPDMTDGQFEQFRRGKIPREMRMQMVTMIIAVLALFLSVMGLVF